MSADRAADRAMAEAYPERLPGYVREYTANDPYFAKSGGLWQRHPITGHGHLIMVEHLNGEAQRIAGILNYYARGGDVAGRKSKGETR